MRFTLLPCYPNASRLGLGSAKEARQIEPTLHSQVLIPILTKHFYWSTRHFSYVDTLLYGADTFP